MFASALMTLKHLDIFLSSTKEQMVSDDQLLLRDKTKHRILLKITNEQILSFDTVFISARLALHSPFLFSGL